jgi:hypothetical protein
MTLKWQKLIKSWVQEGKVVEEIRLWGVPKRDPVHPQIGPILGYVEVKGCGKGMMGK